MQSKRDFFESRGYDFDQVMPILRLDEIRRKTNLQVEDVHHHVPQDEGGQDVRDNRSKMIRRVHEAHHTLYRNELPHEQIISNLDFNDKVYSKEMRNITKQVKSAVDHLHNRELVYKNGVLRPKMYS